MTNTTGNIKAYSDYNFMADRPVAVTFNGGTLTFNVTVRSVAEGFVGSVSLDGTEIYEYPQAFDSAGEAAEATGKHVVGTFARLFS